MIDRFFATEASPAMLIARLVLGAIMLPHGLQKLFGWFGGFGFQATMNFFQSQGIPGPIAFLVILAESAGAVMLLLGSGTRFAALSMAIVMIGAAIFQRQYGLFMNWFGQQAGEGFEYHILAIGLALVLMIGGGGSLSVDSLISGRLTSE